MKISVIQPETIWEDKPANLKHLSDLIRPLFNETDIVVLPEMFNTGFSMNPSSLAEPFKGDTFHWMENIANEGNFGLCGSYAVLEKENYFNRWVFVSPEGDSWYYDKRHLFSMGGEDKVFTAGKSRLSFRFRDVMISPYVCYDLRFPVWSRNTDNIDLMIYSANWPAVRQNVWNTLLRARAIENQCFVAGSNCIGTDGAGIKYIGESAIISPRGETLASADSKIDSCISSELSLNGLSDFRKKFPVSNDADDFSINIR